MVLSPNLITLQEVGVWEKSGRSMEDPKNAFDPSKNVLVFIPYVDSPAEGALIPFSSSSTNQFKQVAWKFSPLDCIILVIYHPYRQLEMLSMSQSVCVSFWKRRQGWALWKTCWEMVVVCSYFDVCSVWVSKHELVCKSHII